MTPPRKGPNTQKIMLQTEDIRQMESEIPEPSVMLNKKGINIPWKFAGLILGIVLTGAGGTWGLQSLFGGVASASALDEVTIKNDVDHTDIRKTLDGQKKSIDESVVKVEQLTTSINKIEATQNRDIARKEARRLADEIPSRTKAEQAYERLFELNLNRLARGADPCGTLSCE